MEDKKSNGLGIVLVLVLIALCAYFVWMYFSSDKTDVENTNETSNQEQETKTISEDEATKEVQEKYILALNIYKLTEAFTISDVKTTIDDDEYYEITDYDKVMSDTFTDDGKKEFEEYHEDNIKKQDDKMYIKEAVKTSEITYDDSYKETTFEKIKIEEDTITYEAKASYESTDERKDFVLKKKNDKWLVDKFHFPYKKTE